MRLMKLAVVGIAGALGFAVVSARAQSFPECPPVGLDTTGCEFLITITGPTTFTVATSSPDLGPYDGADDTLVGVINSSGATVNSIFLSSNTDIFGFDGDGACTTINASGGSCTSPDPNGYGGPGVTYSNIDPLDESGDVNFAGGLPPGGTAWFSLEEALTASQIGPPAPTVTPEPSSLMLLGTGALGVLTAIRRRRAQLG